MLERSSFSIELFDPFVKIKCLCVWVFFWNLYFVDLYTFHSYANSKVFCYYGCIFSRNQSFRLPTSFIFFRLDVSDLGPLVILINFKINLPFSKKKNLPLMLWALYSIFKLHEGVDICLQYLLLFIYREYIWIDYTRVTNWLRSARKTLENKMHHASTFGISDSVSYREDE